MNLKLSRYLEYQTKRVSFKCWFLTYSKRYIPNETTGQAKMW